MYHRRMLSECILAVVATGLVCTPGPAEPLECMKRLRFSEFAIGAWAWPDANPAPDFFDEEYVRDYKEAGHNVILYTFPTWAPETCPPISFDEPLRLAERVGLKAIIHTGSRDAETWGGVTLPEEKYGEVGSSHYARLPELRWLHEESGDSPALVGYLLNDNCGLHDYTVECAEWLRDNHPGLLPWMSTNPDPVGQAKVPMPIITTQNYPFAYQWTQPEPDKRKAFCEVADRDRRHVNEHNMAAWPALASFGAWLSPSQLRFQANAAVAYGAQGIWWFAYDRYFRPVLSPAAKECHRYLLSVAGPRVIGCRSLGAYHTGPEIPDAAMLPGLGRLIEQMDDELLAGVLVPEGRLVRGDELPCYAMVVDKRTANLDDAVWWGEWTKTSPRTSADVADVAERVAEMIARDTPRRSVHVKFGPQVREVEVLLPAGDSVTRQLHARGERTVYLPPLRAGEGVLLELR